MYLLFLSTSRKKLIRVIELRVCPNVAAKSTPEESKESKESKKVRSNTLKRLMSILKGLALIGFYLFLVGYWYLVHALHLQLCGAHG